MDIFNGHWHVPFKRRNYSGALNQNFLWQSENIYVMDNHRAALWCWSRELDLRNPHSIIHIDRHTDAKRSRLADWLENLPDLNGGIEEYLSRSLPSEAGARCPVMMWDNYLSIYIEKFGSNIECGQLLTHDEGDAVNHPAILSARIWDIPDNFSYWLEQGSGNWIVNIDLDFFYCQRGDSSIQMMSNDYIDALIDQIVRSYRAGRIGVITICLTPDLPLTPGWNETEKLAGRILTPLGVKFGLPKE
jgi:UPF0489 domain